ncbi:MAG: chromosome segregation protein ScpA [Candidatus Methanomethylophilaceae archaeon]|nr:chromosome segregation protein ScpA [Candidatus Methanomethylophilaceae archaeon]
MNGGTTNETIEQHLLFHKALIDDNVASEKIDRYLSILNEAPDCERMQDPVDESIRTVFRLVLEQDFDPWSIDLREFVRTYSAKVNSSSKFDIIVAGKLILMAWKVLRMQTDATKLESDRNEVYFDFEDFEEETVEYEPTLYVPGITLRETYARTPQRPVTMIELLDAFEEAREEIIASVERERVRQELKAKEPKTFDNKAHKEVSESDVEAVWQRIQRIGTGAFSLTDLFVPNIDDNITVFLSVLQLVRDGKLNIWQNELPYDDIMVEIKVDWMSGKLEDADVAVKVPEAVV